MGLLKSLKFYTKSLVFGILIILCASYGVVASIFLRIIGKPQYSQYTVARAFYYSFSSILGIKIKINNEKYLQESKPGMFISNHQSALDILVLGKVFYPGFTVTAKKVLKYFPFLGWFMLASGTFFIDRSRGEKARKVLDKALKSVKKNKAGLFMFPEGTRSATTNLDMLPFKKGAFHLAQQAKIPIIPIVVSNYSNIFHSASRTFNTGEIIIDVLPPVPTTDIETKEDVDQLVIDVRTSMVNQLKKLGYSKINGEKDPSKTEEPVTDSDKDEDVEIVDEQSPLVK